METYEQNQQGQQINPMRTVSIILGVLLLLALIGMTIFIIRGGRLGQDKVSLESDKQVLLDEYDRMKSQRDESRKQVADLNTRIENLQSEHQDQIRARDAQISGLRSRANEVLQLRKQVDEFKLMQNEYEKLQELHTDLLAKNEKLDDQFNVLSGNMQSLQDSVDASRGLKVYNIRALTKWDRWLWADRYNVSRARRVDETTISFEIDGTAFTPRGTKTVYLNIIEPQGTLLYPSDDTFIIQETNVQSPYTQKKEIQFTGEPIAMEFTVKHPENLEPGIYLIRTYLDGELLRTGELVFE